MTSICIFCGVIGHFASVCRKKRASQQSQVDSEPFTRSHSRLQRGSNQAAVPQILVSSLHHNLEAPKISIKMEAGDGAFIGNVDTTPDFGAEITVISADTAHSLGIQDNHLSKCSSLDVRAANGQSMYCIGTFTTIFRLGKRTVEDMVTSSRKREGSCSRCTQPRSSASFRTTTHSLFHCSKSSFSNCSKSSFSTKRGKCCSSQLGEDQREAAATAAAPRRSSQRVFRCLHLRLPPNTSEAYDWPSHGYPRQG